LKAHFSVSLRRRELLEDRLALPLQRLDKRHEPLGEYGTMIFPAPRSATASIAAWNAAVSSVTPSPFAPKSMTLNGAAFTAHIAAIAATRIVPHSVLNS